MRFPLIKIKDNDNGSEHIVGTDIHDTLWIEDGTLTYYNLQNGEGSKYGTYSFVGNDAGIGVEVEFVTFEELQLIYKEQQEKERKWQKRVEQVMSKIKGQLI